MFHKKYESIIFYLLLYIVCAFVLFVVSCNEQTMETRSRRVNVLNINHIYIYMIACDCERDFITKLLIVVKMNICGLIDCSFILYISLYDNVEEG